MTTVAEGVDVLAAGRDASTLQQVRTITGAIRVHDAASNVTLKGLTNI